MKYLIYLLLVINISYSACVDMGVMNITAQSLKKTYKQADNVITQIIKQIKNDEDAISSNNNMALEKIINIQKLDSANTLNIQSIFFNSMIINDLQSNLINIAGENLIFKLDDNLEELLQ